MCSLVQIFLHDQGNATVTINDARMRAIALRQARTCLQKSVKYRYATPGGGIRWSSSDAESRQWSTPLAKQLSEAITVQLKIQIERNHLII